MRTEQFDFEKLEVWQRAVGFSSDVILMTDELNSKRKHFRLIEQLEAASSSVSMNIAEGKGRRSAREFTQFLCYSRGSLYEVVTLLTILHKTNKISEERFIKLKTESIQLAKMLNSFIKYLRSK